MRLIDADRLIEDMGASCLPIMEKGISEITGDESCIVDHINAAPTIDAVPVVRCVDCKHRCTIVCPMFHTEYSWDTDDGCDCYDVDRTDDDGFCHLGERWEGEEDD